MKNRIHERKICTAMAQLVAKRLGGIAHNFIWLEDLERQKKAVELRFNVGNSVYVLEHTRIESFPNQIADDYQINDFFDPLIPRLKGKLPKPGYYFICVAPYVLRGAKNKKLIQDSLEAWILANASSLENPPKHFIKEKPTGVPFEVGLYRWKSTNSSTLQDLLFPLRYCPNDNDLALLRSSRISEALNKKCPKLATAKESEFTSILVLESNDIALGNPSQISQATVEQLKKRNVDCPDQVILVGTEIKKWAFWVLKEGAICFPWVPNEGYHEVDSTQITIQN